MHRWHGFSPPKNCEDNAVPRMLAPARAIRHGPRASRVSSVVAVAAPILFSGRDPI